MSTNYYVHRNVCECCSRGDRAEHIGLSAGGWVFQLNTHPEAGIYDLDDWMRLWMQPGIGIKDEFGRSYSVTEMLDWILKPRLEQEHVRALQWHPHAGEMIRRHATYSLVRGEFS